mgnify:CR=1 FL=1
MTAVPRLEKTESAVVQPLETAIAAPLRNRCERYLPALAALTLAAALHLPLFGLRPAPPRPVADVAAPAPPRLRYLPLADPGLDANATDVRVVWSPALFSLPSRLGFRGSSPAPGLSGPSLDSPIHDTARLTAAAQSPAPPAVLAPRPAARPMLPAVSVPRVFDTPATPAALADVLEPLDDGLRGRLESAPLDPSAADGGRGWEAVVWLAFDEAGLPRHALIERIEPPDAPPETRVLLQRGLRAWRAAPGVERSGRVRIRRPGAEGAPPEAAADRGWTP